MIAAVTATLATACAVNQTDSQSDGAMKAYSATKALGFDPANLDTSVRPQDDFYRYVNGGWLARTEIPGDESNYGSFSVLADAAREQLRTIIETAADTPSLDGSDTQKVGDFFKSFMDEAAIDRVGLTPLNDEIARIDSIESVEDLLLYFGHAQKTGGGSPFTLFVNQDAKESTRYLAYLTQSGLGLPDKDYYENEGEKFVAQRAAYIEHIRKLLSLAAVDNTADRAQQIMDIETRLAGYQWERVRNRDRNAVYNKYTIAEANALTPGLDWGAVLGAAGIKGENEIIIRQPDYFQNMVKVIQETPLNHWRGYLYWNALSASAPYLSKTYVDEDFDFYRRTLSGVEEMRPRWRRGVSAVERALGEVVGKLYVEQNFKPEAKARMEKLVENLRRAFGLAIDDLEWMSPATKLEAHAKLDKFTPKIGYPDKWKDYSRLKVRPDTLLRNVMNSRELEYNRMIGKLGRPIDRDEWFMTPQTVNAYYNPAMNEIVFPAAILQPPFFDLNADDAVNYGAIVAVIGHEFSHGFDDQGRKSDGDGNLRDWWTESDAVQFKSRADGLVAQYDQYSPIDGMNVKGEFTLGENIGDLAGLAMAYKAYQLSLNGKEAPVIQGYTGDQRFYMGWGQIWRRLYRDDELRRRLVTDPHSPSEYRVNGIVSNMPTFYEAFDVEPGDGLYREPDQRTEIW
ncbi:MAG: M13 family metallopeptidase [Gammaproteobacteria bacterium]